LIALGATLERTTRDTCLAPDEAGLAADAVGLASDVTGALSTWFLVGQVVENEPLRNIAISSSTIRVGRRPDCDLHLPNMSVSGAHAEITPMAGALDVRDLGSTNGTFVNGIRITDRATVRKDDIVQFSSVAFRVQQEVCPDLRTNPSADSDRALALIQFNKLVSDQAVVPYFQPIVRLDSEETVGYEVLARSRLYGLTHPNEMFQAAAQLDLAAELSRIARSVGVHVGSQLADSTVLYLNTHPAEMNDPSLIGSLAEARAIHPTRPMVLEIHEAAVTDPKSMRELRASLIALDIRLAYDDFGAGQARLNELVEVPPDVLKFDMVLVRGIDQAPTGRQQMIGALVDMVIELGIQPLAEGIETAAEAKTCGELGFELAQGYHFGRPTAINNIGDDARMTQPRQL
jgi:EAL domain-containing protein (putative c-di-GMP-specific phosphodiesterase class I)